MEAYIFAGGQVFAEEWDALALPDPGPALKIAADSGYLTARRLGIKPDLLLGDLDSLDSSALRPDELDAMEKILVPPIKDDTDTQLAVDTALERGALHIHLIGGLGGRLDHTLSSVFLLEYIHDRGAVADMTDGRNRVHLMKAEGSPCHMAVMPGFHYVSLVSLSDRCEGVSISGVYYPLDGVELTRSYSYAVSNEITGDKAEIALEKGVMLVIESRD